MIPIIKGEEPAVFARVKADLRNTPDAPVSYSSLHGDQRRELLEPLLEEQGSLCAYCMCRIGTADNPGTIEHLVPQHPGSEPGDDALSLSYANMVAVCDGREGLTCDKHRGNVSMKVDPTKPHTLESIKYLRDGTIDADDEAVRHDLQETLGLNDSRTYLRSSRHAAMIAVERYVSSEIRRNHIEADSSAKRSLCMKVLEHYENQPGKKDEYLGAKLYRARKLASKFSA